jgi:hypothetical protein
MPVDDVTKKRNMLKLKKTRWLHLEFLAFSVFLAFWRTFEINKRTNEP